MESFRFLWEFSTFYGNLKKTCPLVKSYVFSNKWEPSDFDRNIPVFMGIRRQLALLSKATCWAINGNFPIFIGIFRFSWEFSAFYGNLKKTCPRVKSYVFSNKWELSDLYRNFICFLWEYSNFMRIWRKLALVSKATCSAINGNFPIFIGIFRSIWEFEENLLSCQRQRVQQ